MFRTLFTVWILCFFFFGCAVTTSQQEKAEAGNYTQNKKAKGNSCEGLINEAVHKSSKTMKTVRESCSGMRIEVNPMWSMDYDGTIHVRVHDTTGAKIMDEFRKPSN